MESMIRIKDQEFYRLTDYIKRNFGINLTKKRTLIEGRLNNYLLSNGYTGYTEYLEELFRDQSGKEVDRIINYLTTNYSYFMREWDHFEFYKTTILPQLRANLHARDIRVWSAGCSTGEEAYTLAMLNDEFFGDERALWDKRILATDISEKVLNQARQGIYTDESLKKVPKMWKFNYFTRLKDDRWQTKERLKKEVIFRRFNLMDAHFPFKKKFHVIFCRNVMIYFDQETKRHLIRKFYDMMETGGYLIIGQSESIDRAATGYQYVMPSVHRKV